MDMEKLKVLKNKTKNLSILIVEDSKILQKQMYIFLEKLFKKIYQSYDGEDGVKKFKEFHPDIILTDIAMPIKNGIDMIKEIQFIGNNPKIVILSAHNEEDILMESIKLKVKNFLLKPLKFEDFIDILINLLDEDQKGLNKYTECIHDLEFLHQQKGRVRLVNYFHDMIIEQEGVILDIGNEIISIKIPHTQILAIDNQGNTILELKSINKFMIFRLLNVDTESNIIYVSRPMYTDYVFRKNTHKRYFYNRKFSIGLHDHHKYYTFDVLDIVSDSLTIYTEKNETELVVHDNVNITIPLLFDDSTKNKDIFIRSKITAINRYRDGLKVIARMDVEDKDMFDFKKYLTKIEDEIIQELIKE